MGRIFLHCGFAQLTSYSKCSTLLLIVIQSIACKSRQDWSNLSSVKSQNERWTLRPESRTTRKEEFLRFNGAIEHDPAIARWMKEHEGELGAIAHRWFKVMRQSGDEVRELMHDGCPVVCLGDAPFAYVNVFTSHVNVGFFHGAALPDPARLLQGSGRFMRHVKLKPGTPAHDEALRRLIEDGYADIKARVEHG